VTYEGGGEFLYERLEDGRWAHRCDDLTRLYALAAYRYGILFSDHKKSRGRERSARGYFCIALRARPEVVLDVASKEGLSAAARIAFEAAKRDPFCNPEGGWRTKHPSRVRPHNSSISGV
jgi:hypothetical protein